MPQNSTISSKTITLIIGILVALFLFISVAFFRDNKGIEDTQEEVLDETTTPVSQNIKTVPDKALNIITRIKEFDYIFQ